MVTQANLIIWTVAGLLAVIAILAIPNWAVATRGARHAMTAAEKAFRDGDDRGAQKWNSWALSRQEFAATTRTIAVNAAGGAVILALFPVVIYAATSGAVL